MKLDDTQIAVVEHQTGAKPLPAGDPAAEQLSGAFGVHTFFLDPNGLYIFEGVDLPEAEHGTSPALLIHIAEWTDEERTAISPVEPKPADVIIDLAMEIPPPE